jgi:hypothetical protein
MKQPILLAFFVPFIGFSQLNCKTLKVSKGDSVICFHQNGKVSTINYPDQTWERYTHTLIYDQKGNKVYQGSQGYRHGGGSLYLKYHENGAVSSARSTFQPDGGIQYYDVTTYFNEGGTYLREEDNSRNTDKPTVFVPTTFVPATTTPPPPAPKVDSIQVFIKNTTGKKVSLLIQAKNAKEKTLIHVKKKDILIGKYLPIKGNQDPTNYFDLIVIPNKKKQSAQVIWKPEFLEGTTNRVVLLMF